MTRLRAGQRRIFLITWLAYAGFYFCRKNLSIVLPMLHGVSGLESIDLANIIFGYSLMYTVGQFGFGFLSDRIGPKRVVGAGLILAVGCNLLMGVRASLLWLLIFACLNGVGQATGWSGLVKTMASWFSAESRGVVMAWWGTNYVLGGFLATAFATWSVSQQVLLPELGWRRGFLFPAFILLIITVAFFAWDDDTPEKDAIVGLHGIAGESSRSDWRDLAVLLRTPGLWMIGSSYFFLEMCRYALMFWLPLYMVSRLHYHLQVAGYVSSLYELVGIGGAVLSGYLSDRYTQSRRAPVSAIMLCGLGLVMLFQPGMASTGLVGTAIAISLAGILSYGPDTLLSGAGAQDIGAVRASGTASGLIDGLGHVGSLLSPYIVVYVSKQYGWDRLFFIFAIAAFAAAAILLPIWKMQPADWQGIASEESALPEGARH